jgi:hypothetical protein
LLTEALQALREKHAHSTATPRPRKNLAQFLLESPFAGSDLDLERQQDYGRPVNLRSDPCSILMCFRNSVVTRFPPIRQ